MAFGAAFVSVRAVFFEINTCNLNISARRRRRLFLIANANYSYAALCSHNYRLLPHQITELRGQVGLALKIKPNVNEWSLRSVTKRASSLNVSC